MNQDHHFPLITGGISVDLVNTEIVRHSTRHDLLSTAENADHWGEFGTTLMIAGNIPGKTQTVPTAIYAAVESNQMNLAWLRGIAGIIISFILLALTRRKMKIQ